MSYKDSKRFKNYKKLSLQKYAIPCLEDYYERIAHYDFEAQPDRANAWFDDMGYYDESEREANVAERIATMEDFRDGNIGNAVRMQARIDAGQEYIDALFCNADGIYIDMPKYWQDCILRNNEQIEGIKELLAGEPHPVMEEKVRKLTVWNDKLEKKIKNGGDIDPALTKIIEGK